MAEKHECGNRLYRKSSGQWLSLFVIRILWIGVSC